MRTFAGRLLICIPLALALSWVVPAVDKRQAPEPKLQTAIVQPLPLPTDADPWAGMSDEELLRGDAEVQP
ncbi:hypothetical protein [Uruburuella suis]|uniref:hypothetical protein n=1 Tax=Uruburuella suis TaxID=252130 RepID=UPI001B3CC5F5|nr:hypothetical protein [Uruburuella suis]MBP8043174.1 hypothetical protein [Neisseria sp.]MBP8069437.1 hypothetical protein [Neisseria sp.]MBP8876372.1 hypothetical protein [Neisseria sp.]